MEGFDWDEANKTKNWTKHKVSVKESEEIFFNLPVIIYKDTKHSFKEKRYGILGKTNAGRRLHVIFTIRDKEVKRIRVISARDQNKKERKYYENKIKKVK